MSSKFGLSGNQEHESDEDNAKNEDSSSTSSDEDEDACELTEDIEKTFFKTLSCLKKKDPQIYNQDARFFGKTPDIDENVLKEKRKKKKEIAFSLRDYEKNLLENDGTIKIKQEKSDDGIKSNKKTYVEEQNDLKKSFKKVLDSGSENDEDEIGDLFRERVKSEAIKEEEDVEYRKWLKGQQNELNDKSTEGDMKFLHDYWNDPNLDQGEKFLRDYILNKRFLEKDDDDELPDKLITLEEDEKILNTQTEFEHKFNFRFEEPDQEFIKRYPRLMENSMRKKDDRRKLKREAIKQRKLEEKEQKIKELKKLQSLKRKEIEEKIKKIKEATGNDELGFKDEDIEKDFDPSEHDVHMQKLFSEEFYDQEDREKPFFNDDLDLDQYKDEDEYDENYDAQFEPSCEDPDFNMDCDYTPEKAALAKKKKQEAREKKKNKKKGMSARESIFLNQNIEKPAFDENLHKTFQNYLDEYYSLDCEDFIDDMPCRFKYRQVVPNSFGLSVEEILQADDKELNKWCSLNKVYEIRPDNQELYDVKAYERKARDEELKKKILPSLFKSDDANEEGEAENNSKKKKKKKKKKKNQNQINGSSQNNSDENNVSIGEMNTNEKNVKQNKRKLENSKDDSSSSSVDNDINSTPKSKKMKISVDQNDLNGVTGKSSDAVNTKKLKMDKNVDVNSIHSSELTNNTNTNKSKKKKNKSQNDNGFTNKKMKSNKQNNGFKNKSKAAGKFNHNKHQDKKSNMDSFYSDISDSRLKAYGIKPKKFKNKLKYGSVN